MSALAWVIERHKLGLVRVARVPSGNFTISKSGLVFVARFSGMSLGTSKTLGGAKAVAQAKWDLMREET